jgi:preprotein translocase subunit SecY
MFKKFSEKLRLLVRDRILRKKVLFVLGALLVFRLLAAIPIPGVDTVALQQFFSKNQSPYTHFKGNFHHKKYFLYF